MLTLGSLFDGIGGWQLAAVHNDVKPIWSSEIEKFPLAVTKEHFPETMQLGDITKIDGAKIEPVDIICAGSPCQDLSVAGKQEGLSGKRSSLFYRAINIVRQMRVATNGKYPKFFVWENVPGAFSSNKGMDFKAVLEEITESEIPMPKSGKWATAGMVRGSKCDIAWRVLDAQYWGVPQRRKRVFLVADFRANGRCADKILFERKSLSGDTQAGGAEEKGITAAAQGDFGETGGKAAHPINLQIATQHKALSAGAVACVGNGQLHQAQLQGKSGALNCMHDQQCVMVKNCVRRYTPRECERLQGLPDDFTLIPDKTCSDAARYKALGNGMAQPCADFIIQRIVGVILLKTK